MLKIFREFVSQKGQGIVEYALLLGFVAIVMLVLFANDGLITTFQNALRETVNLFITRNSAYSS